MIASAFHSPTSAVPGSSCMSPLNLVVSHDRDDGVAVHSAQAQESPDPNMQPMMSPRYFSTPHEVGMPQSVHNGQPLADHEGHEVSPIGMKPPEAVFYGGYPYPPPYLAYPPPPMPPLHGQPSPHAERAYSPQQAPVYYPPPGQYPYAQFYPPPTYEGQMPPPPHPHMYPMYSSAPPPVPSHFYGNFPYPQRKRKAPGKYPVLLPATTPPVYSAPSIPPPFPSYPPPTSGSDSGGELFDQVENAGVPIPDSFGRTSSKSQHICNFCGKVYSRRYGLKIHLRTHSGYKPLKCVYCPKMFSDPSNLNKHTKLHFSTDNPKNGIKKVSRCRTETNLTILEDAEDEDEANEMFLAETFGDERSMNHSEDFSEANAEHDVEKENSPPSKSLRRFLEQHEEQGENHSIEQLNELSDDGQRSFVDNTDSAEERRVLSEVLQATQEVQDESALYDCHQMNCQENSQERERILSNEDLVLKALQSPEPSSENDSGICDGVFAYSTPYGTELERPEGSEGIMDDALQQGYTVQFAYPNPYAPYQFPPGYNPTFDFASPIDRTEEPRFHDLESFHARNDKAEESGFEASFPESAEFSAGEYSDGEFQQTADPAFGSVFADNSH